MRPAGRESRASAKQLGHLRLRLGDPPEEAEAGGSHHGAPEERRVPIRRERPGRPARTPPRRSGRPRGRRARAGRQWGLRSMALRTSASPRSQSPEQRQQVADDLEVDEGVRARGERLLRAPLDPRRSSPLTGAPRRARSGRSALGGSTRTPCWAHVIASSMGVAIAGTARRRSWRGRDGRGASRPDRISGSAATTPLQSLDRRGEGLGVAREEEVVRAQNGIVRRGLGRPAPPPSRPPGAGRRRPPRRRRAPRSRAPRRPASRSPPGRGRCGIRRPRACSPGLRSTSRADAHSRLASCGRTRPSRAKRAVGPGRRHRARPSRAARSTRTAR